jgi:hypothetical protein
MDQHTLSSPAPVAHRTNTLPSDDAESIVPIQEERLLFTIRLVQDERALASAVRIRHAAYSRHVPELGQKLRSPETMDYDPDVAVLLAESKLDGSPLGTARIQTNAHRPLLVEQSIALPAHLQGKRLAEVTRLGVENGRMGSVIKMALIKACFMYCSRHDIEWAVVAGRSPLDRQYQRLLFEDLFPNQDLIPLRHAGDLPHRVMAFEIATGHARWSAANHPMLGFFSYTNHPDISIERSTLPSILTKLPAMGRAESRAFA